MIRFSILASALLLVWVALAGCSETAGKQYLGAAVKGAPASVADIQRASIDAPVVLQGTLIEKCPVAGCWFVLQDKTGSIKVDTKNAGFVVVDVPLRRELVVAGRVGTNGTERFIEATGVRY